MKETRQENPFDPWGKPNPWPHAIPHAHNAWEARQRIESVAFLTGVDFETAEDMAWKIENEKSDTEPSRQERITDPELRRILREEGLL